MTLTDDFEIDDELAAGLLALFKELLEQERRNVAGADDARRNELRLFIEMREAELGDDEELDALFEKYIATLPEGERPQSGIQRSQQHVAWHQDFERELAVWKDELAELESRAVDKQTIFNSARNKVLRLLVRAAADTDLLPDVRDIPTEQTLQNNISQTTQISEGEPEHFFIGPNSKGIFAKCYVYNERKIVVGKDSTATRNQFTAAYSSYRKRKEQLITDGVLVEEGSVYRFVRDYEFSSANAVSTIVLGNTGAGKSGEYLKDANGIPFAECYPK